MPDNRIRDLRRKLGMTQKQLAQAAATSQQQIQRIEAGVQSARFDLAVRICAALSTPMAEVFPSAKAPLTRVQRRKPEPGSTTIDETARGELEDAGFDMDPAIWRLKYRLRGGVSGVMTLSGRDKQRLLSLLQDERPGGFAVIDSGSRRYALNLDHLLFCQLLSDAPEAEPTSDQDEDTIEVEVYLSDSAEPLTFGVNPDQASLDDDSDASSEAVQLQELFFYAETSPEPPLRFTDADGETAFFQTRAVSMFSVPLIAVEPKLFNACLEGDDEETVPRA